MIGVNDMGYSASAGCALRLLFCDLPQQYAGHPRDAMKPAICHRVGCWFVVLQDARLGPPFGYPCPVMGPALGTDDRDQRVDLRDLFASR
jgi:hypothetical protein